MVLWLIEPNQKRHRLIDRSFAPCFYAHGPEAQLRRLAQALAGRAPVHCTLTERTNIWDGRPLVVLEVAVRHPTQCAPLVRFAHRAGPGLRLYNSDLMLAPLYCWQKGVFPLAKVDVEATLTPDPSPLGREVRGEGVGTVRALECRDDEWAVDYELPPLVVLQARLEGLSRVDPRHGRHGALEVGIDGRWQVLDDAEEPVAAGFERLLRAHDPDLIVSEWGDATLFPLLLHQSRMRGIGFTLSLNRDPVPVERRRARSYTSYGRILFKGSTTTLFGRLHVDVQNSFIADQCELDGLWELVRVTKLPAQYAARTTTGTGISYMQMELAYRDGVLIPEQKAEPESPKSPGELLRADRGGLVFSPRLGFFTNVAELDFTSEYPSIMARFNVSPETVNCGCCPETPRVPELGYRVCQRRRGITSRVVERLIRKRELYKALISACAPTCRGFGGQPAALRLTAQGGERSRTAAGQRESYKLRRSALKWLLVCCFGYTGYKNARFGKIEAHEAINAVAREKLLVAKETAEQRGFRVLHALVDSLYVQKEDATGDDYARLAQEIEQRTELPLALEALYRYVVFLPSKQDPEVPVPNRFFCVTEEGELKVRGLECRKHDTPPLVAQMQQEALTILTEAYDFQTYCQKLEEARQVLARYLARLEGELSTRADFQPRGLSLEELVISKRLTRPPGEYQKSSATAIAARQLERAGVRLRPGEMIEYIITDADASLPDDRVRAWTLWEGWRGYDAEKYQEMLREAFEPFEHFAPALSGNRFSHP